MPRRHSVDAHRFGAYRRPRLTDDDGTRGATANQASSGEHRCTNPEKFHTKLTSRRTVKSRFNFVAAAVGRGKNGRARPLLPFPIAVPGFLGALAALGTSRRKVNSHQRLAALPAVSLIRFASLKRARSREPLPCEMRHLKQTTSANAFPGDTVVLCLQKNPAGNAQLLNQRATPGTSAATAKAVSKRVMMSVAR